MILFSVTKRMMYVCSNVIGALGYVIVALVLTASLRPLVYSLHRKTKIPVLLSTIISFLVILIPFLILGAIVIPNLDTELPQLLTRIDSTFENLPFIGHYLSNFSTANYLESHSGDILASSGVAIRTTLSAIATFILTFYFVYDYERLLKLFLSIFPYKEKTKLKGLIDEVSEVTGRYVRGNIIISGITFLVIYIGLLIFEIPFALPLAIFAGIFDLLPLVGSTLGAIPSLLVAFGLSPFQGLAILILHLVYQQTENAIISPAIYNKALNLYPALAFLAVLLGASLFGILGAFLALPIAASIPVVVEYHENYKIRNPVQSK